MVQTGGIVLALLNFAFILFKFLNRLRPLTPRSKQATEENREILTSVREGLFLLTPDFRLGSQLSQSAHTLFGRKLAAGDNFFALLHPLVSREGADRRARLRAAAVRAPRQGSAGAGHQPAVRGRGRHVRTGWARTRARHLSFHFNRVQEGGAVRHLLVTVQDISARIELEAKLQSERQRSQKEFAMLLKAIDADPALLRQFVDARRNQPAGSQRHHAQHLGRARRSRHPQAAGRDRRAGSIRSRATRARWAWKRSPTRRTCSRPNCSASRPVRRRPGRTHCCRCRCRWKTC